MFYQEYLPSDALADTIACYWKFVVPPDLPEPVEHIAPPDGCVSLFIWRSEALSIQYIGFVGPRVSLIPSTLYADSVYIGVRFLPGAFSCFFELSADSLRDQSQSITVETPFHALLNDLNPTFNDFNRLNSILLQIKRKAPDAEVAKVVQAIINSEGQCKIAGLVNQAFISERQLQKRFRREVGLSMKEFARVFRMRAALIQMVLHEQKSLDVTFKAGYYDQAHFLHEFQAFAQQKPQLVQKYLKSIQHGNIHW